jgi:import receptor subunit TOM22
MVEIELVEAPAKTQIYDVARVLRKVLLHTGKAAWIFGTTMIVLAVPLIIEMDREQQLMEMENQQMGVLAGPGGPTPPGAAPVVTL